MTPFCLEKYFVSLLSKVTRLSKMNFENNFLFAPMSQNFIIVNVGGDEGNYHQIKVELASPHPLMVVERFYFVFVALFLMIGCAGRITKL